MYEKYGLTFEEENNTSVKYSKPDRSFRFLLPNGYDIITLISWFFLFNLHYVKVPQIVFFYIVTRIGYKLGARILYLLNYDTKLNYGQNLLQNFFWNFGPQTIYIVILNLITIRLIIKWS